MPDADLGSEINADSWGSGSEALPTNDSIGTETIICSYVRERYETSLRNCSQIYKFSYTYDLKMKNRYKGSVPVTYLPYLRYLPVPTLGR